jgi:hypothetical protein
MDLRLYAEIVGFEMGDTILAELIEDTILSLVSLTTESWCFVSQFELKDSKNDINL